MSGIYVPFLRWYFRRTRETLYYEGPHILLWRAMVKCLSPLGYLNLVTFYQKDLCQPLGEIRANAEVQVSQATESDTERLVTLAIGQDPPGKARGLNKKRDIEDMILRRFRQGSRCFVGRIGTNIVHYNWIFFHRVERWSAGKVSYIHLLGNDEAFCDDAYTVDEWRGRGIHTIVQKQMLLFLKQAGYCRVYTISKSANRSSQKTHRRLGWESCGKMLYFHPRGQEKAWRRKVSGTPPRPFVE